VELNQSEPMKNHTGTLCKGVRKARKVLIVAHSTKNPHEDHQINP
jgi:hypothetical protein